MALGRGFASIRALCRSCVSVQRLISGRFITSVPSPSIQALKATRLYTNGATSQLLKRVNTELKLEQKPAEGLQTKFTSFEITIDRAVATLQRQHNQEKVKVQVDANSAIEASSDDMDFEEGEGEEELETEPVFVPTFTVTVTKPSGDNMVFDCSFAEYGSYGEMGNAWESLQINSISVVPEGVTDVENVYCADTANMSDELYSSFIEYLKERKIDETFANEVLYFYRNFEHQSYVKSFLESVKDFVSS